jgi:hypothetical protein
VVVRFHNGLLLLLGNFGGSSCFGGGFSSGGSGGGTNLVRQVYEGNLSHGVGWFC